MSQIFLPVAQAFAGEAANAMSATLGKRAMVSANRLDPVTIPNPGDLINAYLANKITKDYAKTWMLGWGIDWKDGNMWDYVVKAKHVRPNLDLWIRNKYLEGYSESYVFDNLKNFGVLDLWCKEHIARPLYPFSYEQAYKLRRMGEIDNERLIQIERSLGIHRPEESGFLALLQPSAPVSTLIEIIRRFIPREEHDSKKVNDWMIRAGVIDTEILGHLKRMIDTIPGPSDLVRFAVREAWNSEVVEKFGYDDEFDQIPEFKYWMEKTGFGGNPAIALGQGNLTSWSQAYWRAHWDVISPTQAYQMLHRLRPTGGKNNGPRVYGVQPFTIDDVRTVLKVHDYPPKFRDALAAISFNVLRLVDIRRIVFRSVENHEFKEKAIGSEFSIKDWAKEQFLDRGQNQENAESLASLAVHEAERKVHSANEKEKKKLQSEVVKNAENEYMVGLITKDELVTKLNHAGITLHVAAHISDSVESRLKVIHTKELVNRVKKLVIDSHIYINEAKSILEKAGITETAIERYIFYWSTILKHKPKQVPAATILRWLSSNLISQEEAFDRLSELGYNEDDVAVMIADTERKIHGTSALLTSATNVSRNAAVKRLGDLHDLSERHTAEIEERLRRIMPVSQHNRDLETGRINLSTYAKRLRQSGYDENFINESARLRNGGVEPNTSKNAEAEGG